MPKSNPSANSRTGTGNSASKPRIWPPQQSGLKRDGCGSGAGRERQGYEWQDAEGGVIFQDRIKPAWQAQRVRVQRRNLATGRAAQHIGAARVIRGQTLLANAAAVQTY
jgi:hypothetical protein